MRANWSTDDVIQRKKSQELAVSFVIHTCPFEAATTIGSKPNLTWMGFSGTLSPTPYKFEKNDLKLKLRQVVEIGHVSNTLTVTVKCVYPLPGRRR